jgi:hypothetical protein
MAKSDKIEVHVRNSNGGQFGFIPYSVEASQAGRKVAYEWEKDGGLQWLVIKEMTRGGTVVHETRVNAADVVLLRRNQKEIA